MKKPMLTLIAVFMTALAMYAINPEEILGTWESKPITLNLGDGSQTCKVKNKYTYRKDNTADLKSDCELTISLDQRISADVYIELTGSGTYSVEGDSIMFTPDVATYKVKMSEDDVRLRGIDDPVQYATIQQNLYQMMLPMANSMTTDIEKSVLNDVKIDGKTMTCTEDGDNYTYIRRKK